MWFVNWVLFISLGVLNVASLAGLAQAYVVWKGFLGDLVTYYDRYVRQPVLDILSLIPYVPEPPSAIVDLIVIWAGFFLAINFHSLNREGRTLFARWVSKGNLVVRVALFLLIFVLAPFVIFSSLFSRDRETRGIAKDVFRAYLGYLGLVLLVAFVGYQWDLVELAG